MSGSRKDKLDILLVDDSEADVLLVELAFEELGIPHRLRVTRDGVEALEHLRSDGVSESGLPDLILLDLNMPRMGGLEVLLELKDNPRWRTIPVIVLTTSAAATDVWESYSRHANAYVRKPTVLTEFVEDLRKLTSFWHAVAVLSPKSIPHQ